ncbi:chorismate mutase [Saccharopolyspora sp. MS10]|uniref:chorismate mutase n=1 Tax=Saccharopolyspora sp. MS10 TaxID=3385973 RepID=UPI0039A1B01E
MDIPLDSSGTARRKSTPIVADADLQTLRKQIDQLDAELLDVIQRRSEISRAIGAARTAAGGPKIVYNRELEVLARFRALGAEGKELAMILLRLGRGPLGR